MTDKKNVKTSEECKKALEDVIKYISCLKEDEKKISNILDINEEMDKVRQKGDWNMKQHMDTIEAGARKAVKLKEVKEQSHVADVEHLTNQALNICGEKLVDGQDNVVYAIIDKLFQNKDTIKAEVQVVIGQSNEETPGNAASENKHGFEKYKEAIEAIENHIKNPGGLDDIRDDICDTKDVGHVLGLTQKEMREALKEVEEEALKEAIEKNPKMKDLVVPQVNKEEMDKKVKDEKYKLICVKEDSEKKAGESWNDKGKRESMVVKYRLKKLQKGIEEKTEKKVEEAKESERKAKETDIIGEAKDILSGSAYKELKNFEKEAKDGVLAQKLLGGNRTYRLNPAQLIQEWRRLGPYAAKDPPGKLSSAERYDYCQKHARREQIENILSTDQNVHWFHRLHFCAAKAYEIATHSDNYWWRENGNKEKTEEGVLGYLKKSLTDIKAEMESHETPQTLLGRSRTAFLHQALQAIDFAMNDVIPRQSNEVLLPVLGAVHRILDANLDKLEHVEQALALGTTSPDEAKEMLEKKLNADSQKSALGLDKVKDDQNEEKRSKADLVEERLTKDGSLNFDELLKMKPSEMQEWRGKLLKGCHDRAGKIFESMLNGLNSEQRAIMERNRADLIDKMAERLWQDYLKTENKLYDLYKIKVLSKRIDEQRWKDMLNVWAFLVSQNALMFGNRGTDIIMKQLIKAVEKGTA
jgi:hypothetical protein